MRSIPTYISSYHSTAIPISTHQHLIISSQLFYIQNYTKIGLPYKDLQLKKAYVTEQA